MIIHHNIMSNKMKSMISFLKLVHKCTKRTLFSFGNRKEHVFFLPKKSVYKTNEVKHYVKHKMDVFQLTSKQLDNKKHIIYLHGGAYVHKGQHNHYSFLDDLNKELKGKTTYIDYPKAPMYTVSSVIQITKDIIVEIMNENVQDEFIFMGDSSGGNLTLEVTKALSLQNKVIVFSPWMDLSMDNPDIDMMNHKEFMYTKGELMEAAKKYYSDTSPKDKMVSPLFGDYGNSNITIHAGDRDILYPDVLLFEQMNTNIKLNVYHDLPHVFPVFPGTKERKAVIKDILIDIK